MLDVLYHKAKKGKMYSWKVWTNGDTIFTEYGQIDGKKQITSKVAVGKNVGRANETTPEAQAVLEAASMWQNKLDRKYSKTTEKAEEVLFLPMLAHPYEKKKKHVKFPVYVQPKLDGVRCLAKWNDLCTKVELYSRSGKLYNIPHVSAELAMIMCEGDVLDGELYLHDRSFQEVVKLVKKMRPGAEKVEYHVYDVPQLAGLADCATARWSRRLWWLTTPIRIRRDEVFSKYIKIVHTRMVDTEEELFGKVYASMIAAGYEGVIVRTKDGIYNFGHRSKSLLKVKKFLDQEYKIVDWGDGVGKFKGCVIWTCVTEKGLRFAVVPKGTLKQKAVWFMEADKHVGKWLKVQYQEKTADGIPRFPVGLGFRLEEDM